MKQNGAAINVNPNLSLTPALFTQFNNHNFVVNDINQTPINLKLLSNGNGTSNSNGNGNDGDHRMKTDINNNIISSAQSVQSGNNNNNNICASQQTPKIQGETSSHSPSHSDNSTASAITPISPQQQQNNMAQQPTIRNNNPLPIPLIPQLTK